MDVNDDVLGLVLERIDSHVSLIRAAAVCRRWRRAIADAGFLRRFRSLRAPPVAGCYRDGGGGRRYMVAPVFSPSSPSVVDARHFSLDFLPGGAASWIVWDSRGSLLLLWLQHKSRSTRFPCEFPEIVVCEPLTRRYKRIPPPADFVDGTYCWKSYLIDGEADEVGGRIGMSNFRLLCMFDAHADMYTVGSSWSKKNISHIACF